DEPRAAEIEGRAVAAYARLDHTEVADDDEDDVQWAALEIAASRWAQGPAVSAGKDAPSLVIAPGEAGEGGVAVATSPRPRQRTHGQVWPRSLRIAPDRRAAVLAVEPLPGWLELWLFRRAQDGGWMVDVLAPATDAVDLGYVELAGWSGEGARAVIVR